MAIIKTSPIRIPGKWRKGYALDFHIVRSELVGYDHLGREKFDTQRTELGEALFKLKYRNKQDFVEPLATAAAEFIRSKHRQLDYMLAAPPSNQRAFQPVLAVAMALSQQLALPFLADGIIKVKNTGPLKDIFDYHKRL